MEPGNPIAEQIKGYLQELCVMIRGRETGSLGNVAATDFFARTITGLGYEVERPMFDCIDWTCGPATVQAGKSAFDAFPSPYSIGCDVAAPIVEVSTIMALEQANITGNIVLIRGELAREQLMPKRFPFYNPEEHKHIIELLERGKPAAIVAATERNPGSVGGLYPFPLFEDGDFDLPSVFMTREEGRRLKRHVGGVVHVAYAARRIPSHGCNIIARKGMKRAGQDANRIIFCAHIDARKGTPGALDNASGTATLLALAGLLADLGSEICIEIVALNGEDYYAAPGQIQYLEANKDSLRSIMLAINIDDVGYKVGGSSFSLYSCPDELAGKVRSILSRHEGLLEGDAWPQGDHMMFAMNGVPAMAITAEKAMEVAASITHTERDTIDEVDCETIAHVATALADLAKRLQN